MSDRRGKRRTAPMSSRAVTRLSVTTALATPCALIGLAVLASNPDYSPLGMITGGVVLIAALGVVAGLRPTWWLIGPALVLEIGLLVASLPAVRAEVLVLRGVHTPVVVTTAHRARDRAGHISWSCDLRRADGVALPHAVLEGYAGCSGPADVGRTRDLLVDPAGWVPPRARDVDRVGLDEGIALLGAAAALFAGLAIAAGRLYLGAADRARSRPTPPGRRPPHPAKRRR
ncbi:hypothetical protein ABT084_00355 [Streptomyces sp. NPDC002138]|uniref:hypothetical protein n=1 Tax=Streptomyces sp. NPDC002138 TaxID=3154410 RepID=UPI00332FBE5E